MFARLGRAGGRDEPPLFARLARADPLLERPLPDDVAHTIIQGAVEVEKAFIYEILSCSLIGMDSSTSSL